MKFEGGLPKMELVTGRSGGLGMKEGAFGLNPLLVWWGGLLPGEQLVLLELELALLPLPLPCCCSAEEEEEEGSLWSDRTGLEGCWPLAPRDDCWWMPCCMSIP